MQSLNKTYHKGKCLSEWAEELNVNISTVKSRINKGRDVNVDYGSNAGLKQTSAQKEHTSKAISAKWQDSAYRNKVLNSRTKCSQTVAAKQRESLVAKYYKDFLRGMSYVDIADATNLTVDSVGFFIRRFNKQNGYKVITKNIDNQSIERFVYDAKGKLLQF